MMGPLLVDVNVPMYAAGRDHPYRSLAQRLVLAIVNGEVEAFTDAEVLQEILYRYLRSGERAQGLRIFDHFHRIMEGRVLPIEAGDVVLARELADAHPTMSPRDLIHLAVMRRHGLATIASADQHFDGIEGITRLAPAHWA